MATRAEMFAALKERAAGGDPDAMLELAVTLGRADPSSGAWIERAVAAGHPAAHASLGWAYQNGFNGFAVDLPSAIACYDRAIAAGVTTLGPLPLAKHVKALRKQATIADPRDAALDAAKLVKRKAAVLAAVRPSIRWIAAPGAEIGASRLGGTPALPAGCPWPGADRPLAHVATLDFDAAPRLDGAPTGRLAFFYDVAEMSPTCAVIHLATGVPVAPAPSPPGVRTLPAAALTPVVEESLPAARTRAFRDLPLTPKEAERWLQLRERWPAAPGERHRSFGHEDAVQGDMPRRIVYQEAGADLDRPDPALEARAADLVLLLQLDSQAHINWGDAGLLFFWIERNDLAAHRFDRVRVVLQD